MFFPYNYYTNFENRFLKTNTVSQNEFRSLRENKCNFQKTEFFNLRIFYLLNQIYNLKLT
ncbi:hypothetical protein LEP1GSC131_3432 [Leptospira kirschneri str. 200802841]|uniref:Uncharacterized protein n=1 Tax=Leptospira kirschneri str. 200802841 TaxID=1193047 RepID=A0A828Y724_9LEPT|nr:hypothetical protein LEP1GSC131_3432 [Leptospira kirschneri str. 200802841]